MGDSITSLVLPQRTEKRLATENTQRHKERGTRLPDPSLVPELRSPQSRVQDRKKAQLMGFNGYRQRKVQGNGTQAVRDPSVSEEK